MKFILCGYYGYDNIGDDILLFKTIELIQAQYPECHFTVLSQKNPNYPLIQFIPRFFLPRVIPAIFRTDYLIFGGGSVFQDATSLKSLLYYAFILWMGLLFKKKCLLLGHGIGPLNRFISKKICQNLFQHASGISVRDVQSFSLLNAWHTPKNSFCLAADLSYINAHIKQPSKPHNQRVIGVSLRPFKNMDLHFQELRNFLFELNESYEKIIFFSCQKNVDEELYQLLLNNDKTEYKALSIEDYYERDYSHQCHAFIGMRYHALIFASLHSIPFLALSYDDKAITLSQQLEQEYVDLNSSVLSTEDIYRQWQKIMLNRNNYQKKLIEKTQEQILKSNQTIEVLK